MKDVKLRAAIWAAGTLLSAPGWSVTPPPHLEHRVVVFAQGSATLSRQMRGEIESLAQEIGDAQVTVVGRDDGVDSAAQLAQARAQMISATLRSAGVVRAHIALTTEPRQAKPSTLQLADSQISWTPRVQHAPAHPAAHPAAQPAVKERPLALQLEATRPPITPGREAWAPDQPAAQAIPLAASAALASGRSEPPVTQWEVKTSDVTLLRTLERWALDAGFKLKWDAAKNFLIGASDVYTGSFEEALQAVLSSAGIRLSDYPLEACIYSNTPPLVRITRQGDQARECDALNTTAP